MEISTYDAWEEEEKQSHSEIQPEYIQFAVNYGYARADERSDLIERFPHTAVATGFYFEHDYARRWCWRNISPENGPCHAWASEYPGCPLALATEHIEKVVRTDKSGNVQTWERKHYINPGDHEHEGDWSFLWLGKTDYDYGYAEYGFTNETDRENFLAAFPSFPGN